MDLIIVTIDEEEKYVFERDHPHEEIFKLIRNLLGRRKTLSLTGLSSWPNDFAIAAFDNLDATFLYDVYDDFTYGAEGPTLEQKLSDDRQWREKCGAAVVLSANLANHYPRSIFLDNASPCVLGISAKRSMRFIYIGSIDARVDFRWLQELVNSDISLDMYGRVHESYRPIQEKLNRFLGLNQNVRFLGPYDNDDLQYIFPSYAVGILPYEVDTPMTRYVNPDKIYHYLNFGLEVLAAPIPEIKRHRDYLHTVECGGDWKLTLAKIAKTPRASLWPRKQYSWNTRWRELCMLVKKQAFMPTSII